MVLFPSGSLAARALALLGSRTSASTYKADSLAAVEVVQDWYNSTDGLWDGTGWWNSANIMTTLADFAALDIVDGVTLGLSSVFANTFEAAQGTVHVAVKTQDTNGLWHSTYSGNMDSIAEGFVKFAEGFADFANFMDALSPRTTDDNTYAGFINNFYDDEGWWALALLRAYDVTRESEYLTMAESIFADMQGGADSTVCGGGVWWSKDRTYKNAIANELFLAVAASLANRALVSSDRDNYRYIAEQQWEWFSASGLINSNGTINDGLTIDATDSSICTNNGQIVFSYNQGVILGALVEFNEAMGGADSTLLPAALSIAQSAIDALSVDGILHDQCEDNGGDCGGDAQTFKGIFLRNLHYLYNAVGSTDGAFIRTYILDNADSIWANDRDTSTNELGLVWSGPYNAGTTPTTATHGSAMDCLVAALAVA